MAPRTNAQCGELVASMLDTKPENVVGWVVLAITADSQTLILSNARSAEQVRETMRAAADFVEDPV